MSGEGRYIDHSRTRGGMQVDVVPLRPRRIAAARLGEALPHYILAEATRPNFQLSTGRTLTVNSRAGCGCPPKSDDLQ